jgi:MFS family permease
MKKFPPVYYCMALSNLLFFLGNSFFILFPIYLKDLGASESYIGVMNNLDKVLVIAGSIYIGTLIHRHDRVRFLRLGYFILLMAYVAYLFISSLSWLVPAVRVVHGAGFAIAMVLGTTIVFESVPHERATEAIGIYGVTGAITNAVSPAIGELLLAHGVQFRVIFLLSVALIVLSLGLTYYMARLHPALDMRNEKNLDGTLRLFRDRRYLSFSGAAFIFGGGFGVIITFFPNFVRATTNLTFSVFFLIYISVLILIRFTALRTIERAEKRLLLVSVFLVGAVMNLFMNIMDTLAVMVLVSVMYGITHGVLYPVLNAHLVGIVEPDDRGKSNAVFTALFNGGMMVFAFGLGFLIDHLHSYTAAFNVAAGAFALGAVLVALPAAWRKKESHGGAEVKK